MAFARDEMIDRNGYEFTLVDMITTPHHVKDENGDEVADYDKRLELIRRYINVKQLSVTRVGFYCQTYLPCFEATNFVDLFLRRVKDDFCCAGMLGGEFGKRREADARKYLYEAVMICIELGMQKSMASVLLKEMMALDTKTSLLLLKTFANFELFMSVVIAWEDEVKSLTTAVLDYHHSTLPKTTDLGHLALADYFRLLKLEMDRPMFDRYKKIIAAIDKDSLTDKPGPLLINTVVSRFEEEPIVVEEAAKKSWWW